MSHFTRVLVKPRVIAGFVHARPAHLWRMNTIQIQQRKMITSDDSGENLWLQGARIFRLEDSFIQVTRDIGQMNGRIGTIEGRIGTIEWQTKIILAICLTGTGSCYFDGLRNSNMQKSNEAAGEARIRALVEEGFKHVLENMKSEDAAKKNMNTR
ncbi:hypothetical protein BGX38DRAFT_1142186 [Terfezia claveryi]|nr:hypothetical protein BGX38DRAFT_1142186 [Terfezia claveryi]